MENSYKENTKHIENFSKKELLSIFNVVGDNVNIDRSVKIFNGKNITIGSNVRIDAYSVLSAGTIGINIGNFIHIGPFCQLNGSGEGIVIKDFASISSRVSIFTASDDYSDGYMTGPMIPDKYRKIKKGRVCVSKHCIVGSGSIIMPNVFLGEGCSVGAMSFVNKNVTPGDVVFGIPIKKIGSRDLINLNDFEEEFYEESRRNS